MEIKLNSKAIGLHRIARIVKISPSAAEITMHTGEAIHVKCGVRYPDCCSISYPGTFQQLKAVIDTYQKQSLRIA